MIIRILTYSNAHNYGAVLQAYGLQEVLRNLGCGDVKHINYNPKYLSQRYNPFTKEHFRRYISRNWIKGIVNYISYCIRAELRQRAFRKSIRQMLNMTANVYKEKDTIEEACDYLICGSDQIWNKDITKSFDEKFFGVGEYHSIKGKISYAPSTEINSLTDSTLREMSALLPSFDYISVREYALRDNLMMINPNVSISVCLDPTLLAGPSVFNMIAKPVGRKRPYILVYCYNPSSDFVQRVIATIPNKEMYDVVTILLCTKSLKSTLIEPNVYDHVSVPTFVSLFKEASFVVTNSFHGLAFSLIFSKNFNVLKEDNKYIRVKSLLDSLSLQDRFVSDVNQISWSEIEYENVNREMEEHRNNSITYLKRSLNLEC